MEVQIESATKIFEEIEKIRRGCEAKLTHLEKNRRCLDCGKDWMPKKFEPCPECRSANTRLMKQNRKCLDCGYIWQPLGLGVCPWPGCNSPRSEANPKDDPYIRNVVLPRMRAEEEFYEGQLKGMIEAHLVWGWAEQIKGAGLTSIGRLIGKTDIYRLDTVSKMWQHCGHGLYKDGTRQRKRKGQPIDYDPQLQSNVVMLGESLIKAAVRKRCAKCQTSYSSSTAKCTKCEQLYTKSKKIKQCPFCGETKAITGQCPSCGSKETEDYAIAPYGQFYLDQKRVHSNLSPAHRHNRAFRHMIKLFESHFWQIWREALGLPAPTPYVFGILKHPDGHIISPWEMVTKPVSIR